MLKNYYITIEFDRHGDGFYEKRNLCELKKKGNNNVIKVHSGRIKDMWTESCKKMANTKQKIIQAITNNGNYYIEDWNMCFIPFDVKNVCVEKVTKEMYEEEWMENE